MCALRKVPKANINITNAQKAIEQLKLVSQSIGGDGHDVHTEMSRAGRTSSSYEPLERTN